MTRQTPAAATTTETDKPIVCPACGSPAVTTGSKTVNTSTYWHCDQCGEVWNVGRRQDSTRSYYRR